jgi:hypothetical protein
MGSATRIRASIDTVWRTVQVEQDTVFGTLKDAVEVDSHVVAIDASMQRLILLDGRTGAVRSLVGRKGSGPGEFRQVQGLGVWRDSLLLVRDALNARITTWRLQTLSLDSTSFTGAAVPPLTGLCAFADGSLLMAGIGTSLLSRVDSSRRVTWDVSKAWPEHRDTGMERAQQLAGDGTRCYAVSSFGPGIVAYEPSGEVIRAPLREDFGRPKEQRVPGGSVVSGATQSAGAVCVLRDQLLVLRDHVEGRPQLIDVYRTSDLAYRGSFEWAEHILGLHCTRDGRMLLRGYRDGLFTLTLLRATLG